MIEVLYRPAEVVEGRWQTLASGLRPERAGDELASWHWASPSHGDLVRLVGQNGEKLFVFDSARSGFVEAKAKRGQLAWVERWEGEKANAESMLRAAEKADRRRLVLAACACAETALRFESPGESRPRIAIETARAWAHGEASIEDVKKAQDAAHAVYADYADVADVVVAADVAAATKAAARSAVHAAAAAAYDAAFCSDVDADYTASLLDHLCSMSTLVRRQVPLSVLACSMVRVRDPLPINHEVSGVDP